MGAARGIELIDVMPLLFGQRRIQFEQLAWLTLEVPAE